MEFFVGLIKGFIRQPALNDLCFRGANKEQFISIDLASKQFFGCTTLFWREFLSPIENTFLHEASS